MDYSTLTTISEDASCKSDTLSGGKYSLCGLFNNTLSAQTYLGKYGNVKGANASTPYQATVTSFSINDFLFFSFADGALVAFNPNAKSCGVGVGQVITTDMLTSGKLANCLGFVDVNGPNPPNSEVSCADGDTVISVNTTCKVTNGSMGDIFPVVFHDGSVEPATNASLAAFLGGNGKEEQAEQPKYDLSTPEGRKQADVDNMNTIKSALQQAYEDGKLSFPKNYIEIGVYSDGEGNLKGSEVYYDSWSWNTTPEQRNANQKMMMDNVNQILKDAGIDLATAGVNSTDDKWKYGYKIFIEKTGNIEMIAVGKNDNPYTGHGWSQYSNHIRENDLK